jgi:hypothetical protein
MIKGFKWYVLALLAAFGVFLWCRFALPRYQSIDLSITQPKAVEISKNFLRDQQKLDPKDYKMAVSFNVDEDTDRFLQKTLGTAGAGKLIRDLHYDLFSWVVRFFKEKQEEEYRISISSATGEVTGYTHYIKDSAFRPLVEKEKARQAAFNYLKKTYGFNPSQYTVHAQSENKRENRMEYSFSWQDKDIDIPWENGKDSGHARFLTGAAVTGSEVFSFYKHQFEIPVAFNRHIQELKQTGQNLTLVFRIFYLALLTIAIVVVVNRKQQVVSRAVKPFYVGVGIAMFVVMVADIINAYQDILFNYPTTQSFGDYVVRQFIEGFIGPFFIAVGFILPALAGESLRFEITSSQKSRGILNTLLSSFCSMNVARQVFAGYFAAAMMLGAQAFIFHIGFKYWGVWDELSSLTQTSTALLPAFTAMAIGFQASFSEEAMFRLFAINLFKRTLLFLKNNTLATSLAVFMSAAAWGFGHTGYEIFPMWFRGVEVTTIGIIMGVFYLRFGLVCVITTHYLIDSFLTGLPYFLKPHPNFDFFTSLAVVLLPLTLGIIALARNKGAQERPLSVRFNAQQQFNYGLLLELYRSKSSEQRLALKDDLQRHGWDAAIIQRVFEDKDLRR